MRQVECECRCKAARDRGDGDGQLAVAMLSSNNATPSRLDHSLACLLDTTPQTSKEGLQTLIRPGLAAIPMRCKRPITRRHWTVRHSCRKDKRVRVGALPQGDGRLSVGLSLGRAKVPHRPKASHACKTWALEWKLRIWLDTMIFIIGVVVASEEAGEAVVRIGIDAYQRRRVVEQARLMARR